ncbi:MAG: hypothetical protein M3N15_00605, partial [Actinomycetota bacterium]|nr:hypothetical protein [Actinomycetota bacterium]
LVERYEAWYPGVYAPRDERRRVHRVLQDAIRRHRGTRVALTRNRAAEASPRRPVPRPSEPPSAQLELGL